MKTLKFLEEIRMLEKQLHRKVGDEEKKFSFFVVIQKLVESKQLDNKTAIEIKKLWELRNKIYSFPTMEEELSEEILINNFNL